MPQTFVTSHPVQSYTLLDAFLGRDDLIENRMIHFFLSVLVSHDIPWKLVFDILTISLQVSAISL